MAGIPIFSGMKREDLERIARGARECTYSNGEIIIREGEPGSKLFVVVSGEVEVIKNLGKKHQRTLRIFGPKSYFGEMALIDQLIRSASVVARSEVKLLVLDHFNLYQEIERSPQLAMELLQLLSRRIRVLENCMINTLGAFLPICAYCKKIREDNVWIPIEEYISKHSETKFSHTICPECSKKWYPELHEEDTH